MNFECSFWMLRPPAFWKARVVKEYQGTKGQRVYPGVINYRDLPFQVIKLPRSSHWSTDYYICASSSGLPCLWCNMRCSYHVGIWCKLCMSLPSFHFIHNDILLLFTEWMIHMMALCEMKNTMNHFFMTKQRKWKKTTYLFSKEDLLSMFISFAY